MRGFNAVGDFESQLEDIVRMQRAGYRLSVDILHHQIVGTDIEDLTDVGVIQRRNDARFLFKARLVNSLALLDRDYPFEPRVKGLVHLSHSACADVRQDFVRTKLCARRERH